MFCFPTFAFALDLAAAPMPPFISLFHAPPPAQMQMHMRMHKSSALGIARFHEPCAVEAEKMASHPLGTWPQGMNIKPFPSMPDALSRQIPDAFPGIDLYACLACLVQISDIYTAFSGDADGHIIRV